MAVMTSPAMDKTSLEAKAQPVPSTDSMALDSHINGVKPYDALFDEPDAPLPDHPQTNGNSVATNNDINTTDSTTTTAPITNVSSGIDPTAPFLPDQLTDHNSLFDTSDTLAPTTLPPAVEAPTSDIREDMDSIPSAEDLGGAVQPSTEAPESKADTAPARDDVPVVSSDPDAIQIDATAGAAQAADAPNPAEGAPTATELPLRPESNGGQSTEMSDPAPQTVSQTTPPSTESTTATGTQAMTEAPSAGKIRAREEDDMDAEPLAKRTKTEDSTASPEFKVPDAPQGTDSDAGSGIVVAPNPAVTKYSTSPLTGAQQKYLLERLRTTKKIKAAGAFLKPVDPVALNIPTYFDFIKKPMDLSTMEKNLKDGKYSSLAEFMVDFELIISNCFTFNGPTHLISYQAKDLETYFVKGLSGLPSADAPETAGQVKKAKKPAPSAAARKDTRDSRSTAVAKAKSPPAPAPSTTATYALNSDGVPLIRRDSSTLDDGRPKRQIVRPAPKDLPYTKPRKKKFALELKFCETVVTEMFKQKHMRFSFPFLKPVDPVALNIPTYLKVIKKPMDMETIDKKLKAGEYQNAAEFHKDVKLMFDNCYKFNPPNEPVHVMGKEYEQLFDSLWARKQEWIDAHTPVSEPPSPTSSDDEEESEDEELPAQAQILALQEQLAALSNQLSAVQRKASPKAKKPKAGKSSSLTKQRKSSLGSAPKQLVKPKKTKNTQPLTFEQKSEISEGISTLNDTDMGKAIQIIRNGVPHLRHVNEEELEIEMEELPNDVLRELLKFVRSVKGTKSRVQDDDEDFRPAASSNTSGTKPKKNKPMGKKEQEEKIRQIQDQLNAFGQGGVPRATLEQSGSPVAHHDSSDEEDESASESEEE